MKLEIGVAIQIQKPIAEVFENIANPDKMSNYFIANSTGRMEENAKLIWHFPEFVVDCPIRVGKVTNGKYLSFFWEIDSKETFVEMTLTERENNSTKIEITEKSMDNTEAGIKWLKSNTEGWANFLAFLKAYSEYGINLRTGAFDYLRK